MNLDPYLTPYTKINSKWIKDLLNVTLATVELLEENIVGKLLDINLGNDFLILTPKAEINKWGFRKFLHSKGNHQQKEKTTHEMGEILHIHS